MTRTAAPPADAPLIRLLCHLSFWFGLLFATPLFLALHNVADLGLAPGRVAAFAAPAAGLASVAGFLLGSALPPRPRRILDRALLAFALVFAAWGNLVTDRFAFGVFDGRPVDFRNPAWLFWLEWVGWLAALYALFRLFRRLRRIPAWLPALPIASFALLLAPPLLAPPQAGFETAREDPVDPSVFAFSSRLNLVHLLPDGFQGDTVRQVFEADPELAARFEGFTLYTDHLGRYPGTAPSLYTMLTGRPFPLERGFDYRWVGPESRAAAYPAELARAGFQVDMVPLSAYVCPENAHSCHPRPFNNRGLAAQAAAGGRNALLLLADLTAFRLLPSYLKEKIHADGYWLLSDIADDAHSPVPDPVLREWGRELHVVDDRPVYKWYHYVGTHVPPRWDAACDLRRQLAPVTANYVAQARCVLDGIADFIDRLRAAGIYDRTAFIVAGDHGHNTVPVDQHSLPLNYGSYGPLLGAGRPALLVRPAGARGPLAFDDRPTRLRDIAPTARRLAGLDPGGRTVFETPARAPEPRVFEHYPIGAFWSGAPIPHLRYAVGQPASDAGGWAISDIVRYGAVPRAFEPVNRRTARNFVYGAQLRKSAGHTDWSWIRGRQLAFAIDLPDDGRAGELVLELAFEPWMEDPSAAVEVNGVLQVSNRSRPATDSAGGWSALRVPLGADSMRDGPDFVSVLFDRVFEDPENAGEFAAGRVRAIRFEANRGDARR
jgi:hypothetical protein